MKAQTTETMLLTRLLDRIYTAKAQNEDVQARIAQDVDGYAEGYETAYFRGYLEALCDENTMLSTFLELFAREKGGETSCQ